MIVSNGYVKTIIKILYIVPIIINTINNILLRKLLLLNFLTTRPEKNIALIIAIISATSTYTMKAGRVSPGPHGITEKSKTKYTGSHAARIESP